MIQHRGHGTAYLVPELTDELLVARQDVRAILNEAAKGPQPQWRLAVLLDNVEVRVVDTAAHLPDLLHDRVDALREGVLEHGQRRLKWHTVRPRSGDDGD